MRYKDSSVLPIQGYLSKIHVNNIKIHGIQVPFKQAVGKYVSHGIGGYIANL